MTKLVLPLLISMLLPTSSYAEIETPLLPEVKKILEVPPINEKDMDQNAYVHLLTLDAHSSKKPPKPKLEYNKLTMEQKVNGKFYSSPCNILDNFHCIEDTLKDRQQLMELVDKNQKILARYEQITSLPTFHSYEVENNFINYRLYLFLSNLRLFQVINFIDEGNISEGLNIL